MAETLPIVRCADCCLELKEPASTPPAKRKPCANCGSVSRAFELKLASIISPKSKIAAKAKSPGAQKPFYELISGDDLFRLTGQWNKLKQVIDRARDYYLKVVSDPKTGTIIRYCEEPLSKHQGRGSAKQTKGKSHA